MAPESRMIASSDLSVHGHGHGQNLGLSRETDIRELMR